MTTKAAAKKAEATANGRPTEDPLVEAIAYEAAIAEEALAIWTEEANADSAELDALLLRRLRPLLRRPIPAGFIEHVGKISGKPYESSGVRSVQIQMDRLDNVLGPPNWGYEATHTDNGKRCYVRVWVGPKEAPLFERDSWGGMNQGSTEGNLWKGSMTNAAKLALARVGPGWEVYVGAADFDPDTDPDAAKAQEGASEAGPEKLSPERAENLAAIVESVGLADHLTAKLRSFGKKSIEDLSLDQGLELYAWTREAEEGPE